MKEELPVIVWLPLLIILATVAVYQRRHAIKAWLGIKEKK